MGCTARKIGLVVVLGSLVACAPVQERFQQAQAQQDGLQREYGLTQPSCDSAKSCERLWAAARAFVLANSETRFQTVGSDFMETYNPPSGSPGLAWRVTKEPLPGSDAYRIVAKAWCGNMFGCVPNALEAMVRFNRAVAAAN